MPAKTVSHTTDSSRLDLVTPELIEKADSLLPKQRFTDIIPAAKTRNLVGWLSQPDIQIAESLSEIASRIDESDSKSVTIVHEDQEYTISLEDILLLAKEWGYKPNVLSALDLKNAKIYELKWLWKPRYIVLFTNDAGAMRSYAQIVRHEKPSTRIGKIYSWLTSEGKDKIPFLKAPSQDLQKLITEWTISEAI